MLFALIDQGIDTDAEGLAKISSKELRHHLAVAVEDHIISQIDAKVLLKTLGEHDRINIGNRLKEVRFESKSSLGEVWKLAKPTGPQLEKIGRQLEAVKGDTDKLWIELEKDTSLKAITPKLKLVTDLNNLTLGNLPLVARLGSNKAISSLESLAGWPLDSWIKSIGRDRIPAEIKGGPKARKMIYARSMKRMVDYLNPARNIRASLSMDKVIPPALRMDYTRFFQNNKSFDIATTDVDSFFTKNPRSLVGIKNKAGLKNDLEKNGRLLRMAPSLDQYEHLSRMRKMGVDRAGDATKNGYASFKAEYTEEGGDEKSAQWIYGLAQNIQATLGIITMQFNYDMIALPYVMNIGIQSDATWQTLFGSEDYCACSECKSVYSPAAYLADTLHFLEKQEVFDELNNRRPDIQHILLNCDNAHTPMPYIDLVNEVLEAQVVNSNSEQEHWFQTNLSRNELLANPEHVRTEAYEQLKSASYPFSAPFDLFNELGQTYLKHLGVDHHKLVKLFQQNPLEASAQKDWVKASLRLNEIDWELLLLEDYGNVIDKKLWGNGISNKVPYLLKRSQLSFLEFEQVINSRYVNQKNALSIKFDDPCKLNTAKVVGLKSEHRKRIVQVIRLSKKLDTGIESVDAILFGLNSTSLNSEALYSIAQLRAWRVKYQLPYEELVCWLGKIPTAIIDGDNRLFENLFYKQTEQINKKARELFNLNNTNTELAKTSVFLKGASSLNTQLARNYILGAIGISSEELTKILQFISVKKLNLMTLGLVFSVKSRAKALKISIFDLLNVRSLIPLPFLTDLEVTNLEIELVRAIQSSALSIDDVLYIFSGTGSNALTDEQKSGLLREVQEGLAKLEKGADKKDAPLTPSSFLSEKLSSLFGISRGNINRLLTPQNGQVYLISESGKSYTELFLSENFKKFSQEVSSSEFPELFQLCDLLKRISLLFSGLSFTEDNYKTLISEEGKKWINLNSLSEDTNPGNQLLSLLRIDKMISHSAGSTENLLDLITHVPSDSALLSNRIDALFGITESGQLMSAIGLTPEQIGESNGVYMVWQAIALEKHLGISLSEYSGGGRFNWSHSELSEAHVMEIIQVSKAKYGEEKWLNVTAQLRDVIREKQRDALVDFVLAKNNKLNSPEDLYAYLLLDVEMSSCTITSRIKLALSSAQLYVQRYLMNLESSVSMQGLSEERKAEWEEWSWRKNYRVWEANRKVFLYPENWLEPEWRDDKTPFFTELESELQQGELNGVNAEKVYLNYLHKLESVSNLEILAMCQGEKIEGKRDNYYIFGRTYGNPKELYFRNVNVETWSFSPWEKLDFGFEGNHLTPVVHNNRLYVFWPVFTKQGVDSTKKVNGYQDPDEVWRIKLAWSQFDQGKWSPQKVSEDFIDSPGIYPNKSGFSLIYDPYASYAMNNANIVMKMYTKSLWGDDWISVFQFDYSVANSRVEISRLVNSMEEFDSINFDEILKSPGIEINVTLKNQKFEIPDNIPVSLFQLELFKSKEKMSIILPLQKVLYPPLLVEDNEKHKKFIINSRNGGWTFEYLSFHHPFVPSIINTVTTEGLATIFGVEHDPINPYNFEDDYAPEYSYWGQDIYEQEPKEEMRYDISAPYSQYNWELFFHIPMHIANKLRQDQKFEEAQKWFHYVFNPTSSEDMEAPKKFWLFKPFRDLICTEDGTSCNIQDLLVALNAEGNLEGYQEFENAVRTWERNPFSPHTVARTRIIAYMKWVVMRYIDNLIEWADQLFRRDSIESLNEATQLYMLAWNILGGQPEKLKEKQRKDLSYKKLKAAGLDEFSNALVKLENKLTAVNKAKKANPNPLISLPNGLGNIDLDLLDVAGLPKYVGQNIITKETLYFCIPQNPKLLGYWDLMRDRFYKLRNCLNIEGVYRQLPLYEPPIDPALLIKAKAVGLSITDALSSQFDTKSHYRFVALVQKAIDYANDVRVFGGALLSALEKKDAEMITELRSRHETKLIEETRFIRSEQVKELEANRNALNESRKNIDNRKAYYSDKTFMSRTELMEGFILSGAQQLDIISQSHSLLANASALIPTFNVGYSGWGGHSTFEMGGKMLSNALKILSEAYSIGANTERMSANKVGKKANYERRKEDWDFQANQASGELEQIEKQIIAADIRIAIAKKERDNHKLKLKNSTNQLELLQTKFTNVELYDWMIGQLKTVYFQSYQMAFDMAKKAEKALMVEFDIEENEPFIQFGYWDNLKQGLLSGEKLHHDLKRMEVAYIQRNKRKQEVSQTFSLAMIDPEELIRLKTEGVASLSIPEVLFDLAHPKLENRKVKSVSITIPAVTGPYTGVHATLSNGSEHISTSSGQNDSGLFQLNFNDERYLPFERLNPASTWDIKLNSEFRAFDYTTISDVLIHINYTADYRSSKESEALLDLQALVSSKTPLTRFFSLKSEFANEWYHAKNTGEPLSIKVSVGMLPFVFQGKSVKPVTGGVKFVSLPITEKVKPSDWVEVTPAQVEVGWEITVNGPLKDDILLVFGYQIS